ncbi:MAG: hypothetical protein LBC28_01115 [Oscillospiraceae bacterium]|jgi:uncharacterized protein (DUF1778 family)|nr:hypothetical protein [Oscillospiraceae bacterium]
MATTTFDKEIIIDEAAAKRLIAALEKPPREIPDMSESVRRSEEAWQCYLENYRKSSKMGRKRS